MKALVWLLRLIVFVVLFGLGIKNSTPVELRFFLDWNWQAPLSLVLLAAFTAGVVIGLAAALGSWTTQRRQIADLNARLKKSAGENA